MQTGVEKKKGEKKKKKIQITQNEVIKMEE